MAVRLISASAVFVLSVALPPAVLAQDEAMTTLVGNLRIVETMSTLAEQLKDVLTPEIGFPEDYVEHWAAAVDHAFDPEVVLVDFTIALDAVLTDDARDAALAFDADDLARRVYELDMNLEPLKDEPEFFDAMREKLEAGSEAENKLMVDLFEGLDGPTRANAIMDLYFRAMVTAATPVVGLDAAEGWVDASQHLRAGYVEDYFFTTVAVYSQLPEEDLETLAQALSTPELIAYTEQSSLAFAELLDATAERLDEAYKANVSGH